MLTTQRINGYQFSFEEYDDEFILLSTWELRKLAWEYDEKFINSLYKKKTIMNFEYTTFSEEDFKDVRVLKRETLEAFIKDCEFERSIILYSSDDMIEKLDEENPYRLRDFPYKTVPLALTTIKNEYVNESFTTRKYEGILEELPKSHAAWQYVDAIKRNPFFQDEAHEQKFELVCNGEDWYVMLKYTEAQGQFTHLIIPSKKAEKYLERYKDIDYSKVRNKDMTIEKKEEDIQKLTIDKNDKKPVKEESAKAPEKEEKATSTPEIIEEPTNEEKTKKEKEDEKDAPSEENENEKDEEIDEEKDENQDDYGPEL
jgi:hypothetical protein